MNFSEKRYPPNVTIPHILVHFRTILLYFPAQKVDLNFFRFCPIKKSMISLYKLNTRSFGQISFHKF